LTLHVTCPSKVPLTIKNKTKEQSICSLAELHISATTVEENKDRNICNFSRLEIIKAAA